MNSQNLQKLINEGESERLEFKSGDVTPSAIAKVLCAFLNARGGLILIGVRDEGKIVGVKDAPSVSALLSKELPKLISPSAPWDIERVEVETGDVLIINVPEGQDQPYVAEGAIYSRRGHRNVAATRDEISNLIQRRTQYSSRWERHIAPGAERDDLRDDLIAETIRLATLAQRWQGAPNDLDGFLNSVGLLDESEVTNAAVLLYGKNPTRFLPQARLRLVVQPQGKTGTVYQADRLFDSCLLETAKQLPEALSVYAGGVESRFSEEWQRLDHPLWPTDAMREGIMNALVHRDYALSGSTTISIQAKSLEISNPGGLPYELKPADLKRTHLSLPRNPDIAHICFLHGLIEKIGRGTQRIVESCRAAKAREPKWQNHPFATTLTLFASDSSSEALELNERQRLILEESGKREEVSSTDLARLLEGKVTDRTVRSDLEHLVRIGLLIRRGQGRNSVYRRLHKSFPHTSS
jgi:ATP-dependent DNA helicase RecG